MRTPFDTALRVQHRAVETIRVAISLEIAKQGDLEQVEGRLVDQVRSETALAARFALPASSEWLARMRARRHQLRGEVEASGVRVAALRAKAAEAYGAMRAIEDAADRHRDAAEREAEATEQARLDDFSAGRLYVARKPRSMRRDA
ncbi:MAG: hypothetical protein V4472_14495 [Pseudomonadota bacterium]